MRKTILLLAACVFLRVGSAWAADTTYTFATWESPRMNATTGYIDWAQVSTTRGARLINVFGYNGGAAGYVQLFNSTNGPVGVLNDSQITPPYVELAGSLGTGDAVQFTNTTVVATAKVYYVRAWTNNQVALRYQLYDTRAHAVNAAATTGIITITADAQTGFFNYVPKHSFAVASTDNYSFIITGTGMQFGRGIVVAASSTGPLFTPTTTNITICATYLPSL